MDQTWEQASSDLHYWSNGHYIYFGPNTYGVAFVRFDPVPVAMTFPGPEPLPITQAVPEASSLSMLLVGMACLAGLRAVRSRRR